MFGALNDVTVFKRAKNHESIHSVDDVDVDAVDTDIMSVKRALGECNGAWDACSPAPGKRIKPAVTQSHEQTMLSAWAEVLDHGDGSIAMQQVLSVQVGGQTKLFGQNGLLLEPWRRDGHRTIYRSLSLSFDECFGQY